jgi:hypothetical protein
VLELRRNLRYWVMALPIISLILFPILLGLSSYIYSFTLAKGVGVISTISPDKASVEILIDQNKQIDLKSGKRMFYARINNRENLKYGFRKLVYKVKFFDKDNKEVDQDNTKYENFMMPKEVFYISHFASTSAVKMDVSFLLNESDLVNVLPDDVAKYSRKVAELSNLSIDITRDDFFTLNFLINNTSSKTLKNLKYQYILNDKKSDYVYIGNLTISELKDFDKSQKSIDGLSYPLNIPKGDLGYITDNNTLRYNFFEYEQ